MAKSQQVEANTRKMERETLKTFWLDNDGNAESQVCGRAEESRESGGR